MYNSGAGTRYTQQIYDPRSEEAATDKPEPEGQGFISDTLPIIKDKGHTFVECTFTYAFYDDVILQTCRQVYILACTPVGRHCYIATCSLRIFIVQDFTVHI